MKNALAERATPEEKAGAGLGLLVLLGILTAFDSMSVDMYLPAFTIIQDSLGFASGTIQMSLSVFLLGLAVGQSVSGPLADGYGRRVPLLIGIAVFGVASAMVAFADGAGMFMAGRFLQGLGGAAGLVIPRAIVSDLYNAESATKIFTFLVQVQSISPIIAPPLGGLMLGALGWRSIFWVLVVFSAATLVATVMRIPETHPEEDRTRLTLGSVFGGYWRLLCNRRYLGMTLSMGFIMATLFGYISGSSFVFMTYFGLSPTAYSIIFAVNSIGMILVGQLNFLLVKKMSLKRHLGLGFAVHLFFLLLFLIAVFMGVASMEVTVALLFFAMSSLGLLFGGVTSESMYSADARSMGSASALLGVVQYVFGGGAGIVLGIFHDNTLVPYAVVLCVCSIFAVVCWALAARIEILRDAEMPSPEAVVMHH